MDIVAADIGGTHARFAIATIEGGRVAALGEPVKLATADHASFETAWHAFGAGLGRDLPRAASIAIAAPIGGDAIKLTNNPWTIRPGRIDAELGLDRHRLINDFTAVAHAVAAIGAKHLRPIAGPSLPLPDTGVVSIVGPGTGLGVAQLVRRAGETLVLPTEGGHSDFAPLDPIEDRVLARLRETLTRVSVERVVAGPGLRAIYDTLAAIEGRDAMAGDDKTLWTAALDRTDPLAAAALDRFCQCLGAVTGDIALTQGAGAVVLAGGLGLRLADVLSDSGFHDRFVAKGRHRSLMESLPIHLITHPEPGLLGAAAAFAKDMP